MSSRLTAPRLPEGNPGGAAGDLLRHGRLELDVGPHRERLLAVRRGELPWAEVERWRLALHADLDDAVPRSPLPALPDTARVDAWLYSVRARSARSAVVDSASDAPT